MAEARQPQPRPAGAAAGEGAGNAAGGTGGGRRGTADADGPPRAAAFEFGSATGLGSFLLTCLEELEFRRGTEWFDHCLNRIYISANPPQSLHVRVPGDRRATEVLARVAVANGAKVRRVEAMTGRYTRVDVADLLRRVRLQPAATRRADVDHVLLGLWGADDRFLRTALMFLGEVTGAECEVAFVRMAGDDVPSHLLLLQGATHLDAVLGWIARQAGRAEAFVLQASDERRRFYVPWGTRYPLPGLERLSDIRGELVLICGAAGPAGKPGGGDRPGGGAAAGGSAGAHRWLAFEPGEVNFFRKMHEVFDPVVHADPAPLRELAEDPATRALPLELAIAAEDAEGPRRLWQLDKTIDQQRQKLHDLETRRARLAAGKVRDVYFAYKFEQAGADHLNPPLVRFLQQRLSVLADYDYAWRHPADGPELDAYDDPAVAGGGGSGVPFHLLIAKRTQQEFGCGIELADATYYQPQEFRRWGVNLYLPVGKGLRPPISEADAIPLLQKVLEMAEGRSVQGAGGGDPDDEAADGGLVAVSRREAGAGRDAGSAAAPAAQAILWEDAGGGRIRETRVTRVAPVLGQFRLLNTFQQQRAAQVTEQTRRKLMDELRAARDRVAVTCRDIERDVIEWGNHRCDQVETTYKGLQASLARADADVAEREPQVRQVTEFVGRIPAKWAEFVQGVLDLHHAVAGDQSAAVDGLRAEFRAGRDQLRTAARLHADVNARIAAANAAAAADREALDGKLAETAAAVRQAQEMNPRLLAAALQIRAAHARLAERLAALAAARRKADKIQADLDNVERREREVKDRLRRLEGMQEEIRGRQAKVKGSEEKAEADELNAAAQTADVKVREDRVGQRLRDVTERLRHLEAGLARAVVESRETEELFRAIDEESQQLEARARVVDRWEEHANRWSDYLAGEHGRLDDRARQAQAKARPPAGDGGGGDGAAGTV